ncbi:MAG: lytic murein transglycosylase, partial [Desulfobacteraceae bacterium]
LKVWRDLQEWQALGVRRLNGTALPTRSIPATLIVGDPVDNKGYIIYRDFCSIMKYNPAFKYAIAIGLLADHLREY